MFVQFVKWSCGCKGIKIWHPPAPTPGPVSMEDATTAWVIVACDRDIGSDEYSLFKREMSDRRSTLISRQEFDAHTEDQLKEQVPKKSEPLDQDEVEELLDEIGKLMHDGYNLRHIRSMLTYSPQPSP